MAQFQDIIGKFVILMIIVFGLMMFAVGIQDADNSSSKIENNSVFNTTLNQMNVQIGSATSEANEKYDVFNDEVPQPGFGSIILFGIVSAGKTFSSIAFGFMTVLIKLPLIVLGIPSSAYNLLIVWLVIGILVALWGLYKLGG